MMMMMTILMMKMLNINIIMVFLFMMVFWSFFVAFHGLARFLVGSSDKLLLLQF